MTQEQQDAVRGMDLARLAMIAKSEGDDAAALSALNEARTMAVSQRAESIVAAA